MKSLITKIIDFLNYPLFYILFGKDIPNFCDPDTCQIIKCLKNKIEEKDNCIHDLYNQLKNIEDIVYQDIYSVETTMDKFADKDSDCDK